MGEPSHLSVDSAAHSCYYFIVRELTSCISRLQGKSDYICVKCTGNLILMAHNHLEHGKSLFLSCVIFLNLSVSLDCRGDG